jgi:hypothetical protein
MAQVEERTQEQVLRELEQERTELATAVESLRTEMGFTAKLSSHLPLLAAGAFVTGFVVAGGIGATARLIFRRGRER